MDHYFAGAEQQMWRTRLADLGVEHVSLSWIGLRRRGRRQLATPLADMFPDSQKIYLDSGAYTLNREDSEVDEDEAAELARDYYGYVRANINRIEFAAEFDAMVLGDLGIRTLREWADLPLEKMMPIWHSEYGTAKLRAMATLYPRLGILQEDAAGDLTQVLRNVARETNLHGVAMTKMEAMKAVPWDSVGSTSWLSPTQYGDTFVWTGHELKRYPKRMKDQARKRHRTWLASQGFDMEKIQDDDNAELLRLSVWSWQNFAASLNRGHATTRPVLEPFDGARDILHEALGGILHPDTPEIVTNRVLEPFGPNAEPPSSAVDTPAPEVRNDELIPTEGKKLLPVIGFSFQEQVDADGAKHQIPIMETPPTGLLQCDTCLAPDTRILYADGTWRRIGDARAGDVLMGVDEESPNGKGSGRRLQSSTIEAVRIAHRPTLLLETDTASIVTTDTHRWLQSGKNAWRETQWLRGGHAIRSIGFGECDESDDYKAGYVAGLTVGDGAFRDIPSPSGQVWWRIALSDMEPLVVARQFFTELTGLELPEISPYYSGRGGLPSIRPDKDDFLPMFKFEARRREVIDAVAALLKDTGTPDYARGFQAGFFDAEGSNDGHAIRVYQKDVSVLRYVQRLGKRTGFIWKVENYRGACPSARLTGNGVDRVQFILCCRPRIQRKIDKMFGVSAAYTPIQLRSVAPTGRSEYVVDIQTSTRTFITEGGLVAHNCYMKDKCPAMTPGADCAYEIPVKIRTSSQLAALHDSLIEMQTQRVLQMRLIEQVEGGYVDANLSSEIDRLNKMIKSKLDAQKEGFSIKIEGSSTAAGAGMIGRVFGTEVSSKMGALPAGESDSQDYIDVEILNEESN
jgi:hypothetical protein